jgi:uncharacterized protein (UPF0332 family)/predicted nucleotidyltransferase
MPNHLKNSDIKELLSRFKREVLTSDIKNKIIKIILFGSVAKGSATTSSDIDILIFTAGGKNFEKALMDKVYDFMIGENAALEVLTSSIDELYSKQDFFIYNVNRYGKEIYSMEEDDIKKIMINDLIHLSGEYLESAKEVFDRKRFRLAIDAAYNAAELASKALIFLKKNDLPGSHGGVVSLLGQLYVKTKEIDMEIGRRLNMALKLRNEARYKPNALLTDGNAKEVLDLAGKLLEIVLEKM